MEYTGKFNKKRKLIQMDILFSHVLWVPWNKSYHAEALMPRVIDSLEQWYGGNKFVQYQIENDSKPYINVNVDSDRKEAQKSSIEDFCYEATTGSLAFVGNSNSNVAELGPSLANPGGIFLEFAPKIDNFTKFQPFPLPLNSVAKKIIRLDDGNFVVITNNESSYFLKPMQ